MKAHSDNNLNLRMETLKETLALEIQGRVSGLTGLTVQVLDFGAPVGAQCEILARGGTVIPAEVIGFHGEAAVLMPLADMTGIGCGDRVLCRSGKALVWIGDQLLGRVINGNGKAIDGKGNLLCQTRRSVSAEGVPPLQRTRINSPIATGVKAIDGLMTCGCGQRMGIFSGPGVGKSILLGMIARNTEADVNVIALVGERGREVREFIERDLGPAGLARSVVVVSISDEPAPIRVRAAFVAATIAEYFRDQGKNVLLLMDSVTRIAMAQRQIGLAMNEPPATKGYTPSVFALMPRLLERCGRSQQGSITGFYAVLVEGDDLSEPISDAMRGILDGHLWLSRELANRRHYPAIDILQSISRVMPEVVRSEQLEDARFVINLTAVYRDIEDLVNIGAYAKGTNPQYDLAITSRPQIERFLRQGIKEGFSYEKTRQMLKELVKQLAGSVAGDDSSMNQPGVGAMNQGEPAQAVGGNQPSGPTLERMRLGV